MQALAEKFNLNNEEQNHLLTSLPGEGLLFAMNDHIPLHVVPSPQELELITTNPDEVRKREEALQKLGTTTENLEPYKKEKNFYLLKELNQNQIEFLKNDGYVEARLCGLNTASQWYLVKKPATNESIEHYFMVQAIFEEIRKYTENVNAYSSFGPDITFQVPRKDDPEEFDWYALEIETGTQLEHKNQLEQKTQKNNYNPHYKKWWYVVTDKNLKKEYEQYHETMTRAEIKEKIGELF